MDAFFQTEERKLSLQREAGRWIGTPFFPHGRIRSAGVDCVQLCAAIYIGTGFLDEFEPGKYTMDGGRHAGISKVIEWIEASGKFYTVTTPAIGDLLCFKIRHSKVEWHAGLMTTEKIFVHVLQHRHVVHSCLGDLGILKLTRIYRPKL